jgi:hypothetical protein
MPVGRPPCPKGDATADTKGRTIFGIEYPPGAGRPVELIVDSGAEMLVLDPTDTHVLA